MLAVPVDKTLVWNGTFPIIGKLDPINQSEQFNGFTSTATPNRCPGGATQSAPDGSNPFVNPPHGGSSISPSECNPKQGSGG